MEKLDEGFFDQYTDDFADYFENQRVMRIMLGSEYKKINKAICEIKDKHPNVTNFLEDEEIVKLNDEEESTIHPCGTPRGNCRDCNPGGAAFARFEFRERKSKQHPMCEQSDPADETASLLCGRF